MAYAAIIPVLTSDAKSGLALFNNKAKCEGCHVSDGLKPAFTRSCCEGNR